MAFIIIKNWYYSSPWRLKGRLVKEKEKFLKYLKEFKKAKGEKK